MPKKTTILIVILAIITGVLIFLAVKSDQSQELGKNILRQVSKSSPTQAPKPYATLSFSPPILDVSSSQLPTQSVDIVLDTNGKPTAGAQAELSYDPKVITNVTLKAPLKNQLFGTKPTILINSVDPAQGRISYAVGISPTDSEKKGIGSIATLTFTVNKFAGVPSSQITFLPKSAVTTLATSGSILSTTTPLKVQIAPAAAATATPSGY